MKTVNLIQGTPEWKAHRAAHFNASDAPAMMGVSKYKTRSQLLKEMATGIVEEVDAATERRFADGHRFEALARPIAEEIIGDSLSPVTGTNGKYSASFDGITFDKSIIWECKTLNAAILECTLPSDLPSMYMIQMEHQMLVSGAEKCLFSGVKFDSDNDLIDGVHIWYSGSPELRKQIIAGWDQFAIDLANYQHTEAAPEVIAAPVQDLPALSIQVNGSISLISNLEKFGARLNEFVAKIDKSPTDDQGFADAEAAIKTLQSAQDALEAAESNALAQTSDIDNMRKTVKLYADTARTTRLMLEKMVKARKETIRIEIVQKGKTDLDAHVARMNTRLGKPYMPEIPADFAGAIKGKKTLASLREAVNNEYLRAEREASSIADKIEINLNTLRELAKDHAFLFSDTAQLVGKANDDLVALVKVRITEHQAAEAAKEAATRARIQAEEEAKARAKIEAEERAKLAAVAAEEKAKADVMNNKIEELIGEYWDTAHAEGSTGVSAGTEANAILHDIRAEIAPLTALKELENEKTKLIHAIADGVRRECNLLAEIAGLKDEKSEREKQKPVAWFKAAYPEQLTNNSVIANDVWRDGQGWDVRSLYAASGAQPSVDVDWLSNVIREVDGNHTLGAGELAEKIVEAIKEKS